MGESLAKFSFDSDYAYSLVSFHKLCLTITSHSAYHTFCFRLHHIEIENS